MRDIIIIAPSFDPTENVGGISSVASFIIENNKNANYLHFELGKKDNESVKIFSRIKRVYGRYRSWKKFLHDNNNAIIHYNWPLCKASIIRDYPFMRYAMRHNRKMVVHIHGGAFLTNPEIPLYLKMLMHKVFLWNIPFVVLSEQEKVLLENRFGVKNVISLPNCVNLSVAKVFERQFDPECLHLGYLGRIEPNKGMTELLEACKQLKGKIPFVLHIAGKEEVKDHYLPRFSEILGDSFRYEGVVYGERKTDFLKKVEVFILPSYYEGLPMSLLECMSFGSIPVVTPVGSIPSICIDGKNAVFIKVKSINTIVDKIISLWNGKERSLKISKEAKNTIFRDFSPTAYIDRLNCIYASLQ